MLGKLRVTGSLRGTIEYNEEKVMQQKAVYLHAENFLKDTHELTFEDKYNRLHDRVTLNERAEKKVAHIFLTFHPDEEISNNTMVQLSQRYMQAAGFDNQPYLVYRHFDSGNPHLHVVSTKVLPNGKMIKIPTRQMRELQVLTLKMASESGLRPDKVKTQNEKIRFQATRTQQVVYGQPSLKNAISSVLHTIIDHYKYHSMEGLNAILSEYNVKADPGREGTRMHLNRGLVYAVLDENGRQVSRGIRASAFDFKPTLPYLEKRFELNRTLRERNHLRMETAIEWTLMTKKPDWAGFRQAMAREGINVVVQEDREGKPGNIFFIDHREKTVFSGHDLGGAFSLQAIQERCAQEQKVQEEESQRHHLKLHL